jgi:hypothetical protein
VDFRHTASYTYAAADMTQGYRRKKAREVTRQFVYLRKPNEFFVIFDRVEATETYFPKHWFLHIPSEPSITGSETIIVPGHAYSYEGRVTASWQSDPAGETVVKSTGVSCAYLTTLLPERARVAKRGGEGYEFWGHPEEPTAQYNHVGPRSKSPPVVPWRLEVAAPAGNYRDYFLHVIEISDSCKGPTQVELSREDDYLGVNLPTEDGLTVTFAAKGPLNVRIGSSSGLNSKGRDYSDTRLEIGGTNPGSER